MTKEDLLARLDRLEEERRYIFTLLDLIDDPSLQPRREELEEFLKELNRRIRIARGRIHAL